MSSAPTALTTKSSIRCTRTPISHYGSITNCAIGNTPTTACALTSRSPTSLLWNSSPVGNFIGERQSVTNLLDEYRSFSGVEEICYTMDVDSLVDASARRRPKNYESFDAVCEYQGKGNHEHAKPGPDRPADGGCRRGMLWFPVPYGIRE